MNSLSEKPIVRLSVDTNLQGTFHSIKHHCFLNLCGNVVFTEFFKNFSEVSSKVRPAISAVW